MDILWFEFARNELVHIRRYIGERNPRSAKELARRIIDAVEGLRGHPGMGRPGRLSGTRELVINGTPYIVLYRVRLEQIEILRVMHSSRKWPENRDEH
ncbi:MAG TPA: type II toxin-antitoxin system RelE/ParE family toxin [Rhodospirillales bacterium]|nr:type II toxin-antitoxin system RelE/ParE family toxin [Rhodospirillales bacterium]